MFLGSLGQIANVIEKKIHNRFFRKFYTGWFVRSIIDLEIINMPSFINF